MLFYIVKNEEVKKLFMCDNSGCVHYETRYGMPMEGAETGFQVYSMQKFDACSPECRDAIAKTQRRICE